jgi:hypothetical protein
MKLEGLANELLLDLFELLDAIHLLRAFYGLNSRFNTLLFTHFRAYHLDFRSISKHNFNIICQQYLPIIINRVITLHLSNENETPNLLQLFLSYNFTFNQFNHLQKLSLYYMSSFDTLNQILIQCRHLPYLTHLNLLKCNFEKKETDVLHFMNNIWCLSKLTHCNLDRIFLNEILLKDMSVISQSIEYLSLENIYCPLDILFYLFKYTPRLRLLRVNDVIGYQFQCLQPVVSSLSSMNISFSGSMRVMEVVFQNLPNLYHLTIRISNIYLNGYEWEKIIVNQLPKIKVFRLKMEFRFLDQSNKEEQIDDLLDSFRTHFWIEEHRWFVRYDFNSSKPINCDILYTLPYTFEEFIYADKNLSKSTCPNDNEYDSYDQVRILRYSNQEKYLSKQSNINSFHFPNIRHLKIKLPCDEHFLKCIPSMYHLTSLNITLLKASACFLLQVLLDRAPNLYSLTVKRRFPIRMTLFQVKNTSIRRLFLVSSGAIVFDSCFDSAECAILTNSTLGIQCEVLSIDVKCRTNILDLIKQMSNLRSLTVQCEDDQWDLWQSSTANDELVNWLQGHLPSTCLIIRDPKKVSSIHIWIDS